MANAKQVEMLAAGLLGNSLSTNFNGLPLAGGKVTFFDAGTANLKTIYKDAQKAQTETNPVILDSVGVANVYADGTYDIKIQDADDIVLATYNTFLFKFLQSTSAFIVQNITASTTITAVGTIYLVDTSAANITITLMATAGVEGQDVIIINTGTGTLTISAASGENVSGSANVSSSRKNDIFELRAAQQNWYDIGHQDPVNSATSQSKIDINTSNIFRLFDEIQNNHGGTLLMEKGWSDSFGLPNQQGADEANSMGEKHDNVNFLYEGVGGGVGLLSDFDFTTEANYIQKEETGADATIAGDVVTIVGSTFGLNVTNARFSVDNFTTEGQIKSRDSATQITLWPGHGLTGTSVAWKIRFILFSGGVAKLNESSPGEYTPDANTKLLLHCNGADASIVFTDSSTTGHTVTAVGNAQLDTSQFRFGTASGLFDGVGDNLTVSDNAEFDIPGDFTIDFWIRFNVVPTIQTKLFEHQNGTNGWSFILDTNNLQWWNDITGGQLFSQTPSPAFVTGRWYHIAMVRSGNNWMMFQDGKQLGTTFVSSTAPTEVATTLKIMDIINGWIDEVRFSPGIARWTSDFIPPGETVINETSPVIPSFSQLKFSGNVIDINSVARTETLNGQNIWYAFIFAPSTVTAYNDANVVVTIYNTAGSLWKKAIQWNGTAWQKNTDVTNTAVENWITITGAGATDITFAIAEAIDGNTALQMTGANMAGIVDADFEISGGFVVGTHTFYGIASVLKLTTPGNSPSVDQVRTNWDTQNASMDLKAKTFDPNFVPIEAYLWALAEHTDADGPGVWSVTRDGGTTWKTMTMAQQGLAITGDIKIYRGTFIFTTEPTGQDFRCRYVTTQNKTQKLRSWGLQARP